MLSAGSSSRDVRLGREAVRGAYRGNDSTGGSQKQHGIGSRVRARMRTRAADSGADRGELGKFKRRASGALACSGRRTALGCGYRRGGW